MLILFANLFTSINSKSAACNFAVASFKFSVALFSIVAVFKYAATFCATSTLLVINTCSASVFAFVFAASAFVFAASAFVFAASASFFAASASGFNFFAASVFNFFAS